MMRVHMKHSRFAVVLLPFLLRLAAGPCGIFYSCLPESFAEPKPPLTAAHRQASQEPQLWRKKRTAALTEITTATQSSRYPEAA